VLSNIKDMLFLQRNYEIIEETTCPLYLKAQEVEPWTKTPSVCNIYVIQVAGVPQNACNSQKQM